jgi:hypothetical protein
MKHFDGPFGLYLNDWNKPSKKTVSLSEEKQMNIKKTFTILGFLLAFLIVLPVVRADETNEAIKVTFNQPVQIPGRVLPAGTYWFLLPNEITQHYQVRIYSSDRTIFYATVDTIEAERPHATDNIVFTFAERGSAQPHAIVSWFYPGSTTGHEFLYPKQVRKELAKDKQDTIVVGD